MESKRQRQVNELIKRHFATILTEQGRNIYGQAMVSVTNVIVSPDLGQAKIYFSVFNHDNKEEVLTFLDMHKHQLKQALAYRIRNHVRRIPKIYFYMDETVDEIYRVDALFTKIGDREEE